MQIKIANFINDSIVDGPGIRFTIFTQGCNHNCKGCHNETTHNKDGGVYKSVDELVDMIKKNPLLDGVTFSGGEPLLQYEEVSCIAKHVKELGLNTYLYTGFLWESIKGNKKYKELLQNIDVIIDGLYEEDKKTLNLIFRGSTNQRIINVKESLLSDDMIQLEF